MEERKEDVQSENYDTIMERKMEAKRKEVLRKLLRRIGQDGPPLNVVIIGTPGAGKSSFINTIMTSITKEWRNYVEVGSADAKTLHMKPYDKEKYLKYAEDKSKLLKYNFPTIIDLAGITDANDETTRKLLDLIFSGRIPPNANLLDVIKDIQSHMSSLDKIYPCTDSSIKVDRVIFVVSASNPNPPFNLLRSLKSSLTSGPRAIPVFGVITKTDEPFTDLKEKDYKAFVSEFKSSLGILDINILQCTNYCDKNLKDIKEGLRDHIPKIDTPVLQFLRQVFDPVQTVTDNEEFRNQHPRRQNWFPEIHSFRVRLFLDNLGVYLMVAIFILIVAVFIILFFKRSF